MNGASANPYEEPQKVKKGDLVKIDYTASLNDGIIVDTSIGFIADNCGVLDDSREYKPLEFIVGSNCTIPGLEENIVGMSVNESKTFVIPAKDAFGERDDAKAKEVPKEFGKKDDFVVGEHLAITDGKKAVRCHVTSVNKDSMVLDLNHPLAGKDIVINVKLIAINGRPPSSEKAAGKQIVNGSAL
jgi:FKBP-type peptidyl-prolyl cis-trans isomerase 2